MGVGLWVGHRFSTKKLGRGVEGWALPELEDRRQEKAGTRFGGRARALRLLKTMRDMQICRAEGSDK